MLIIIILKVKLMIEFEQLQHFTCHSMHVETRIAFLLAVSGRYARFISVANMYSYYAQMARLRSQTHWPSFRL